MKLLRIHCSAHGAASESYRLSQRILDHLAGQQPAGGIAVTDVDATMLAHVDQGYARALSSRDEPAAQDAGALAESNRLIAQLRGADALLIATPMHNFTVSSALKAWIDHVVRVRLTFRITPEGKLGNLPDRPVYVAVSSGGVYDGPQARQPDFLTPYLRHVLATIGLESVAFFSVQGTAAGPDRLGAARAQAEADLRAHFEAPVLGARLA